MMTVIRKGVALLIKFTMITLLVAMLSPILYFVWHVTQPMAPLELKGMSYVQFLAVNKICEDYLLNRYHASHPEIPPSNWDDMKYRINNFVPEVEMFFLTGYTTFNLLLHWDIGNIERSWPWLDPPQVTWLNFIPAWWQMVDQGLVHRYQDGIYPPGAPDYCNRPLSPDEFHALKQKLELSTAP